MTPRLTITPENARSGAQVIGDVGAGIAGLTVPDSENAAAGLGGFVTATALPGAKAAVQQSLTVISARYGEIQNALRRAVDSYEEVDQVNRRTSVADLSLSGFAGSSLMSLGDLNSAQ